MRLKSLMGVLALVSLVSFAPARGEEAPVQSTEPAASSAAAPLPAIFSTPEPSFKSSCSASLTCGDGNTVSCTGNTNCSSLAYAAVCDGVSHRCPNYCIVYEQCYCGGTLQCSSNVGSCSGGDDTVTCNGNTLHCPNFCL